MKNWIPLVAAVLFGSAIAIVVSFLLPSPPSEPAPGATPAGSPETPPRPPSVVVRKTIPNRTPKPSTDEDPARHLHEEAPDLVEFTVNSQGLAVTFGDVILGEPEETGQGKVGYYRPDPPQLWKDLEIPFRIDPSLPNPARVLGAIEYLNKNTRVRFVPFRGQEDAIFFEPGKEHCHSYLGRVGGHQPIYLSPDCGRGEILHEILHALGFIHEQSRSDRDQFVKILWANIKPEYRPQFDIVPEAWMGAAKDTPFDYQSIMLYRANSFALRPDLITMQGISGGIAPLEDQLSPQDLERLSRLYR